MTMAEQKNSLNSMFSPKSIVIIGASGDQSKISYKPVSNLKEVGYEGEVYLVNPKYEEIAGYPCYKNIKSLPLNIDLALVVVGASAVQGVLEELQERKVKSIVILSSGFSEIGVKGKELEAKITEFSASTGISICGPNCIGITNFKQKTMVSFSSLKHGDYDSCRIYNAKWGSRDACLYTCTRNGVRLSIFCFKWKRSSC